MKCLLAILISISIFICSSLVTIFTLKTTLLSPIYIEQEVNIIIKKGYSLKKIIEELETLVVIRHPVLLKILSKIIYKEQKFLSGEYNIQPKSSLHSILEKISIGNTVKRHITIPPGLTNHQIIQKLINESSLSGDIPQYIKEGSLFPDTYIFQYNDSRSSLIERMQQAAKQKFDKIWQESKDKDKLPFKSIEDAIILASIVEKEAGKYDNMTKIAGVFINRLKHNMKLQSDPTIIYAVSNGTGILNRKLTKNDTKISSQYNTYYIKGLPPTPIANPSVNAFIAVLNPLKTDDLYFVSDKNGSHYFSKTLVDHNKYIAKYHK